MNNFSFEDLKLLKRNSYSKSIIDNLANEYSSYRMAYNEICIQREYHSDTLINKYITKNLLENPFAICHAIIENNDVQFLEELYEKQYGDFLFAFKINHVRKLLIVQIINANSSDTQNNDSSFSKLIEYLETNSKRELSLSGAHEIGDFGFIKCAMMLDHTYGIQDVLAVIFRILSKKYKESLYKKLEEATFAIPLNNAKYGIVAMVNEFKSFKLNGKILEEIEQRDMEDLLLALDIYKKTQYQYRYSVGHLDVPRNTILGII